MLRETRARLLATLTATVVVLLVALFAWLRNLPPTADAQPQHGQRAFERLGCADCHSFEGIGNPAAPLDGIGARLEPALIRAWASGSGIAAEQLPAGIIRRKQRAMADPQFDELLAELGRSR
jgi:mono/diheme cytochrome c family protein